MRIINYLGVGQFGGRNRLYVKLMMCIGLSYIVDNVYSNVYLPNAIHGYVRLW